MLTLTTTKERPDTQDVLWIKPRMAVLSNLFGWIPMPVNNTDAVCCQFDETEIYLHATNCCMGWPKHTQNEEKEAWQKGVKPDSDELLRQMHAYSSLIQQFSVTNNQRSGTMSHILTWSSLSVTNINTHSCSHTCMHACMHACTHTHMHTQKHWLQKYLKNEKVNPQHTQYIP